MTHVKEMYALFAISAYLIAVPIAVCIAEKLINKILIFLIGFALTWITFTSLMSKFPESVKCNVCQKEMLPTRNSHMSFVNVGKGDNETVYRRYFCSNCERFQLVKEIK